MLHILFSPARHRQKKKVELTDVASKANLMTDEWQHSEMPASNHVGDFSLQNTKHNVNNIHSVLIFFKCKNTANIHSVQTVYVGCRGFHYYGKCIQSLCFDDKPPLKGRGQCHVTHFSISVISLE